ncbi:PHP domain-containing protein [Lacibacter luteus]|uniref:PHP domain-containing protein n=1 Tax=Lacibacter luteus TaxID=2508719 RepID=A0A4V1M6Z6_9BACT|nr:PHP domain-containing protein [Lacibacter luteus]RXK57540.1 PHP domain-containing protein [Lacibacter luteus]
MSNPIPYKGTRWFKCDLHLHTPASKCFQDQSVTPEQWVQRAIDQGLNCVAITDHNTGAQIDLIKVAAQGTGLVVFPGVEITCDTSKVHLLILFDLEKTTDDVNDFLIRCGIDRSMFSDQLASTTKTIFEVSAIAHNSGGIVIPAHIDEFNGLGSISNDNLNAFFDYPYINAVQVVHKAFLNPALQTNNNEDLRTYLNEYYDNPSPVIDYTKMGEWYRPVKVALSKKVAITTFSDNPHEPKNSKHGLDGIGKRFTWIKMDENPTLEGLRQAFLLPEFRVKNDFDTKSNPHTFPDLWIKSISIRDTTITGNISPLEINFSPQLTTIIGGRGSGKSSIIRFIRGLFNRVADLSTLSDILNDHNEFYKHTDQRTKKGVLNSNSEIEVEFVRNTVLYKIRATRITNSQNQTVSIHKLDTQTNQWELVQSEGFLDFFQYEQYSQKQIYEIAQEPNSLRERIDRSIIAMDSLKNEREVIKKEFFEKAASIRTIQQQISGKGRIQTEIADLNERVKLFQQSGISSLLVSKEKFSLQKEIIDSFVTEAQRKEGELSLLESSLELPDLSYEIFEERHSTELKQSSKKLIEGYTELKKQLEEIKQKAEELRMEFETQLSATVWKSDFDQNQATFDQKREELESQGIKEISNFEIISSAKTQKEKELEKVIEIELGLASEIGKRDQLQADYLEKAKQINQARRTYIDNLLPTDKIKVSINFLRNKADFIQKLRSIIQRPDRFEDDVDFLADKCFNGNTEQKINEVREIFRKIRRMEKVSEVSGHFENLVRGMTDAQMDELELLLPEDEVEIKYKPSGATSFKPLSTASAGQKTTAVLTFILSQGELPLILDQPEDDLDNRLVYELIVDRLRQAKETRQIIVVTHNANIPVNGDAEYVVSMNSDSKTLEVLYSGSVEQANIKKEICDVMEGSEQAFDMRSKRYKQIS